MFEDSDSFDTGLPDPIDERILHVLNRRTYEIFKDLFPDLSHSKLEVLIREYNHMRSYNPFAIPLSYTEYENGDQVIVAYNFSRASVELIEFKYKPESKGGFIGTYSNPEIVSIDDKIEPEYAVVIIRFLVLFEKYEAFDRPLESYSSALEN